MINAIDATGAEAFLLRCRANTSQRVPLTGHANAFSLLLRILNILPDAGSRLLHLQHPNFVNSQFQSITSALEQCTRKHCSKDTSNNKDLLAALLTARQLDSTLAQFSAITADNACDDTSIRSFQSQSSSSASSSLGSGDSQDWATRPFHRGPSSCSTDPILLQHAAHAPNQPAQQPHGPASCSTVSPSTVDLQEILDINFPDSASTQAHAAFSGSQSTTSRLAAEHSAPSRAFPIAPEHLHLIKQCHGGCAGHNGRDETIRKLQAAGHCWSTRYIDVARYIASCETCQRHRLKHKSPYAMYKTILTDAPLFCRWHMDFLSIQSPCSFTGATKVLVMQEERSRYVMLHACTAETAIEVVLAFLHTFAIFGIPESIRSDNAQNLCEASVRQFMEMTGITHDFSIAHQAHTNGLIESSCGDTGRLLRMLCCDLHAYGKWSYMLPLVQRQLNSLTRSTIGTSANQLLFGNRVNLDRYVIPVAPLAVTPAMREAVRLSDTVQNFTDSLLIAQQDILSKADTLRTKILNDLSRQRPFNLDEYPQEGQLVLVPWNDTNTRPEKLLANSMGPYVIIHAQPGKNTVALAHTIHPTPPHEKATLISAISDLIIFDDSLALTEYDVPENRFRQLAYHDHNTRAINCILTYRPRAILTADARNHVTNMDYEVRFENASSLADTAWLPYSAVSHTFAFESFWHFVHRDLIGHRGIALPSDQRLIHQTLAGAASKARSCASKHQQAAQRFDLDTLAFPK